MRFLLAAAAIAACWPVCALSSETLSGPYDAWILRVIDGDTVEARIRIWLGQDLTILLRLRDINTPELRGPCPGDRAAAEAARAFVVGLLPEKGPVRLTAVAHDKYHGRIDAAIELPSGQDLAAVMPAHPRAAPACRVTGDDDGQKARESMCIPYRAASPFSTSAISSEIWRLVSSRARSPFSRPVLRPGKPWSRTATSRSAMLPSGGGPKRVTASP